MTHKLRWLALSGLMALLAASAAACGEDETPAQKTRCDDVECGSDPNVECDPADGICKCGGPNGLACLPGEACVIAASQAPSCTSSMCVSSDCKGGTTCDPVDGECKCGGDICDAGEICTDDKCVSSGLCVDAACGAGEECDPTDGLCKCGEVACSFGQQCIDGECKEDACAGVNCGADTICNPDDGLCHCGELQGPACTIGQTCVVDGEVPVCEGVNVCENSNCPVGTVCDPTSPEGVCRCGGIGPTNPVCAEDQTCDMQRSICIGGDQCADVVCDNGNSCNEENGSCACGGMGGVACEAGQVCAAVRGEAGCQEPCSPLGTNTCGTGRTCVFDATQADRGTFCVSIAADASGNDRECTSAFGCAAGLHCASVSGGPVCRAYCEMNGPNTCGTGMRCNSIDGGPANLGYCGTVN